MVFHLIDDIDTARERDRGIAHIKPPTAFSARILHTKIRPVRHYACASTRAAAYYFDIDEGKLNKRWCKSRHDFILYLISGIPILAFAQRQARRARRTRIYWCFQDAARLLEFLAIRLRRAGLSLASILKLSRRHYYTDIAIEHRRTVLMPLQLFSYCLRLHFYLAIAGQLMPAHFAAFSRVASHLKEHLRHDLMRARLLSLLMPVYYHHHAASRRYCLLEKTSLMMETLAWFIYTPH